MSLQLTNIKKRIKSVTGAYKVTSAMKLVSTVRLRKYRSKMLSNKNYIEEMDKVVDDVLSRLDKKIETPFNQENINATKNLYVIISSTLGLCGSYNNNVFRMSESKIKEEDDAIILGKKGILYFKNQKFGKIEGFDDYSNYSNEKIIKKLVNLVNKAYENKEYREIHLIYTEYKNSIAFIPRDYLLLPIRYERDEEKANDEKIILEPSQEELVNTLIPIYLNGVIHSKLLESEVCEQAARCNAMDSAVNNAKDILDSLQIEFNKARQASITQEITEIVGASNSK